MFVSERDAREKLRFFTYVDLSMAEDIKLSLGGLIGGELLGEGIYVAFLAFLYNFSMLTMCVSPS